MSDTPLVEDEMAADALTAAQQLSPAPAQEGAVTESPRKSPGWRNASPIWMLAFVSVAAISTSGTVAPRVEIYTRTICRAHGVGTSPETCSSAPTPEVQAHAAQLMAIIASLSGLLSTITAAWWGSLSDCNGRIWVLGANVTGLMLSDITFLTVVHFWESLPGTYWWFALGPIFEGMVGGISVASTVMHAYISDCSDAQSRSRAFSQLMGLLFVGMSIGPLLSGWIMRTTGQLLPVFYVATAIDTIVSLSVWFIMPESLPPAEMEKRRAARAQQAQAMGGGWKGWAKRTAMTMDIVSPMTVLFPKKVGSSMDWTMPILGAAYGFGTLIQAAIYQQIQYAWVMYGWTSDVISYWLGAIHIAKAVYLTLLFPGLVKLLTHLWSRQASQTGETQPLLSNDDDADGKTAGGRVASMDLWLARAAVLFDMVFYALAFGTRSGALFALFTMCISFGTHFQPTLQSLALHLYARHGGTDTGRLLGALTVVSALSSHIVGPALFGLIYMKTVATVPGAFYLLQCAALLTSLVLLMFVRLRKGKRDAAGPADSGEEEEETD